MASPLTIALAAYDAGLRLPALTEAVAIALAESGGNERAHNAIPPDDSYGLWQINMIGDLGPARRAQFGIASNDALYDIDTNAKAMFAISSGGTNWKPWTTYKGARYWFFTPAASAAATAALAARGAGQVAETVGAPIVDVTSAAVSAAGALAKAGIWLADRNNWVRIAKVAVGAFIVVNAVAMLAATAGYEVYDKSAGLIVKPLLKGLKLKGESEK